MKVGLVQIIILTFGNHKQTRSKYIKREKKLYLNNGNAIVKLLYIFLIIRVKIMKTPIKREWLFLSLSFIKTDVYREKEENFKFYITTILLYMIFVVFICV